MSEPTIQELILGFFDLEDSPGEYLDGLCKKARHDVIERELFALLGSDKVEHFHRALDFFFFLWAETQASTDTPENEVADHIEEQDRIWPLLVDCLEKPRHVRAEILLDYLPELTDEFEDDFFDALFSLFRARDPLLLAVLVREMALIEGHKVRDGWLSVMQGSADPREGLIWLCTLDVLIMDGREKLALLKGVPAYAHPLLVTLKAEIVAELEAVLNAAPEEAPRARPGQEDDPEKGVSGPRTIDIAVMQNEFVGQLTRDRMDAVPEGYVNAFLDQVLDRFKKA